MIRSQTTSSRDPLIRPARLEDLPALVDLLADAVPDCLPETVWQLPWTWAAYLVAEDDGDLVGAASLQRTDPRAPLAEIRGLPGPPTRRAGRWSRAPTSARSL